MLTGDYQFKNIFSGIITNLEEERFAINLSNREKLFCLSCKHTLNKFKNYNRVFNGVKFLLDIYYCDKCRIVYELAYVYNREVTELKRYIKRNKLSIIYENNYAQLIN